MSNEIHQCQCPLCQKEELHPDQLYHRQINLLMSSLNEQQRRWYAALESLKIGHGGIELMTLITGVGQKTIRVTVHGLETYLQACSRVIHWA